MPDVPDCISFRRFTLNLRRRVLLVDDRPVPLHDRAFDILDYLIRHRDRAAGRQEIMAHVWKGVVVAENNLTVQMHTLRRTLAEHGGEGLIITLTKGGYRFVGDIADIAPCPPLPPDPPPPETAIVPFPPTATTPQPPARRALWLAAASSVTLALLLTVVTMARTQAWFAPAPPRLSIAVLPFRNLTDGGAQSYMADAITDDLTTDLAHIPGSVVIARESADAYRNTTAPSARIGRALNVRYLLQGSLRAQSGAYHINAQLIEAATGTQPWTERFDVPEGQLAQAQTTIVRRIASTLDTQLTDLVSMQAQHDRPNDPDAQDLFLRGRSIMERDGSLIGFSHAQALLEQAVSRRPDYADALAELGLTLVLKVSSVDDPDADADLVRAAKVIDAALRLTGGSAIALAAQARLNETQGNCRDGMQNARAALTIDPDTMDALAVLARCTFNEGNLDAAADYENAVLKLNPGSSRTKPRLLFLAQIRLLQGRFAEAADLSAQASAGEDSSAEMDALGRAEYARLILIAATQLGGDSAQAHALYQSYAAIWPNRTSWRIGAYSPRGVAAFSGSTKFLAALEQAGMPRYADEHSMVQSGDAPGSGGDFAPVPLTMPHVKTVDAAHLYQALQHQHPLIIDVGLGAAMPPSSLHVPHIDQLDGVLIEHARDKAMPVVVMGTGTFGTQGYMAARHLWQHGYSDVWWFRGGEEAWAASAQPSGDERTQN